MLALIPLVGATLTLRAHTAETQPTGRIWGVWNKKFLPVTWETVKVTLEDAYRIRRVYRRLAKMRGRGHLRRLTVFIWHENVVRLL
jgi:hypothetical protein